LDLERILLLEKIPNKTFLFSTGKQALPPPGRFIVLIFHERLLFLENSARRIIREISE
jgi:hypothetical protein